MVASKVDTLVKVTCFGRSQSSLEVELQLYISLRDDLVIHVCTI